MEKKKPLPKIAHKLTGKELIDLGNYINYKVQEAQKEILRDFNRCLDKEMYRETERKWNDILFSGRM